MHIDKMECARGLAGKSLEVLAVAVAPSQGKEHDFAVPAPLVIFELVQQLQVRAGFLWLTLKAQDAPLEIDAKLMQEAPAFLALRRRVKKVAQGHHQIGRNVNVLPDAGPAQSLCGRVVAQVDEPRLVKGARNLVFERFVKRKGNSARAVGYGGDKRGRIRLDDEGANGGIIHVLAAKFAVGILWLHRVPGEPSFPTRLRARSAVLGEFGAIVRGDCIPIGSQEIATAHYERVWLPEARGEQFPDGPRAAT